MDCTQRTNSSQTGWPTTDQGECTPAAQGDASPCQLRRGLGKLSGRGALGEGATLCNCMG
eukprot:4598712-Alexandrium_andersonii.AAC.1